MDLNAESFDVVGTVGSAREIRQVKLDLIPSLIESHGHRANEWLHSGCALVVGGTESAADTLIIEYLDLEREVLLQL